MNTLVAILALLTARRAPPPTIVLTRHNFIAIQGDIHDDCADQFLRDSMLLAAKKRNRTQHYVFIDTFGGSVMAGNRILNEIQRAQYVCIADRAYSMGFVLLQACAERLVMPTATLMQHQMSLSIDGDIEYVHGYIRSLRSSEQSMNQMQATRLGLTLAAFDARIANEWWLFGAADIFRHRAADGLVDIVCAPELVRQNRTVVRPASPLKPQVSIVETRSRCPLLRAPLHSQVRAFAAAPETDAE